MVGRAFAKALKKEFQRKQNNTLDLLMYLYVLKRLEMIVCFADIDAKTAQESARPGQSNETMQANRISGITLDVRHNFDMISYF